MTMHNPPHPGEFIREVYLEPFGLSARQLESITGSDLVKPLNARA